MGACVALVHVVQVGPATTRSSFGSHWSSSINLGNSLDKTQFVLPINERETVNLIRSWRTIHHRMIETGVAMFAK